MLYHLFQWLDEAYNLPGAGLFQFSTFRAALAVLISLGLSTIYGERIIKLLQRKQMGEQIRDLGLEGQAEKAGTPTMGGLIIIGATAS
jgi:phospho-N-acetylmuramoyl-pentapeptide-transferase